MACLVACATNLASAQDVGSSEASAQGTAQTRVESAAPTEQATPVEHEASDAPSPVDAVKSKPAPNSVFLEGLGAGLYYSVNYERRVIDDLGLRIGLGYVSVTASSSAGGTTASSSSKYLTIPISVSYLGIRSRRHGLELGAGMTLSYSSGSVSAGVSSASGSGVTPFGTAIVGYRLHPVGGAGFQFRVGAMALAAKGLGFDPKPDKFGVLPWFYISFGAGF
jgi:hypothetical protein